MSSSIDIPSLLRPQQRGMQIDNGIGTLLDDTFSHARSDLIWQHMVHAIAFTGPSNSAVKGTKAVHKTVDLFVNNSVVEETKAVHKISDMFV